MALTTNEIASLPDNYAQAEKNHLPDLPQGLFETNGDWVNLSPGGEGEIAPAHDHFFGACSPFLVLMRTPGGRQAATNYLNKLDSFQRAWVYETNHFNGEDSQNLTFCPDLPQFPADTEFALVRRMCVIDTGGNIRPTPVVISLQKRHYLAIAETTMLLVSNRMVDAPFQKFFEFRMNRARDAALRSVGENEKDFSLFFSVGFDFFEGISGRRQPQDSAHVFRDSPPLLNDCATCHGGHGIYSVNSYTRLFSPRSISPPKLYPSDIKSVTDSAIDWKLTQYNWGLLQGLWAQAD